MYLHMYTHGVILSNYHRKTHCTGKVTPISLVLKIVVFDPTIKLKLNIIYIK